MSDKQLLPRLEHVEAKDISLYINSELSGEKSLIIPEKADNILDFADKFAEERNNCQKFCLYGLVESKWGDCDNLKIEFRIADSSSNINPDTNLNIPFWFNDKSSNVSANTYSILSRSLDFTNGDLSKNIFGKKKASFFMPFELNVNDLTPTNKSIYIRILDVVKNLSLNQEFPFIFFDEDDILLEYGIETALIQENGTILEVNNNYPYLYDRHWIRRELEAEGPAFVYFNQSSITYTEGGSDDTILEDKNFEIEVSLSKPPNGYETIKFNVLYGLDENLQEYTTVNIPQDLAINLGYMSWTSSTTSQTQILRFRLNDDYFVEALERLTLQIVPILGVLPDLEKSQTISLYFIDNDVPSKVAFEGSNITITEPTQIINPISIPIKLVLDRKLYAPNQQLILYIDTNQSDCESFYGFNNVNYYAGQSGSSFINETIVYFNTTDTEYFVNLYFRTKIQYDVNRKIVLKMKDLSSNLIAQSFNINQDLKYTIYVNKSITTNFVTLKIPYDMPNGRGPLRSVYNLPKNQTDYDNDGLRDSPTVLSTFRMSSNGYYQPGYIAFNAHRIDLLANKTNNPISYGRQLVYTDILLKITNLGKTKILYNNNIYNTNDEFDILLTSDGWGTGATSSELYYNGSEFILTLPTNDGFSFNIPNQAAMQGISASTMEYYYTKYSVQVTNINYNWYYQASGPTDDEITTNVLTKNVFFSFIEQDFNANLSNFGSRIYQDFFIGNKNQTYNFYTELKNVVSQIYWDSSNTTEEPTDWSAIEKTFEELYNGSTRIFYPGIIIIPNPGTTSTWPYNFTESTIFISQDYLLLENSFTPSTIDEDAYYNTYFYQAGTQIFTSTELQNAKKAEMYNLGPINVQAGVGNRTWELNIQGMTISSKDVDAPVLSSTQFMSSSLPPLYKNLFIFNFGDSNLNTKLQAIIEIKNLGDVPVNIFNTNVDRGNKIWITEFPIQGTLPVGVVQNIVRPLTNLSFPLQSNNRYINKIVTPLGDDVFYRAFSKLYYEISFLNFRLYNFDGTDSGKIVNKSVIIDDELEYSNPRYFAQPNFLQNFYYLFSRFQPDFHIPSMGPGLTSSKKCSTDIVNNFRPIGIGNQWVEVEGFLATASNFLGNYELKFSKNSTVASRSNNNGLYYYCDKNGIIWAKVEFI